MLVKQLTFDMNILNTSHRMKQSDAVEVSMARGAHGKDRIDRGIFKIIFMHDL